MTAIDIIIVLMVVMGIYKGFRSGAIKTVLSIFGWIVALIVASQVADVLAPMFAGFSDERIVQISLASLTVVFVIVGATYLLAHFLSKTLKFLRIGFLDNIAGAFLGILKGLLKVMAALTVMAPLLIKMPSWEQSVLAQTLVPFAPIAKTLVAETAQTAVSQMDNPYKKQ